MVGISEDGAQMKQRLRRIAAFLPRRRFYGSLVGFAVALGLGTVVLGQGSPAPSVSPPSKEAIATPAATSVEALAAEAQKFSEALLAAARAGDNAKVASLIDSSFASRPAKLDESTVTTLLNDLLRQRELTAFTVLHDRLKETNFGKNWKPDDAQLSSLVRDGRTDFLDVLLARRLDLNRLQTLAASAGQPTADWITRRVAEVARQRADLEALGKAAADNDLPAMQRLVDGDADVDGVGKDDNTPLLRAVSKDRLEAAQWLLDHGAQVDQPRFPGWNYTPLCLVNSVPMAELLKKNGANLHAKLWRRDVNILVYVAEFGKPEVVEWFLQQGLDPKMVGDNHENLLFNVASTRTAELLLGAGVDPNQVSTSGGTPLCTAKNAEIAQLLLDHGAKVTGFKEPLLPRMIQFGSGGAVEVALKAGAEHDPAMMQALLIQAAHMDRDEIAAVLLKYGAKPNEPGVWSSETDKLLPLQTCCIFGSVKTAKVLLAAGADPNGGTAPGALLKNAMHNGYKELSQLLRQAGAKGVSDLSFALASHDANQVKALLATAPAYQDDAAFWDEVLPGAARLGDVDTVQAALARGVPVEAKGPGHGADAYTAAASEGQHETLAILLATRPPDANPADLRAAMWEAVWNCHPYDDQRSAEHFERCVEMLLAAKAPVNGYDDNRDLMTTAVFSRNPGGNPKVMEMLARAGADPNPVGKEKGKPGKHLLDYVQAACAQGNCSTPVADTLIKLCHLNTEAGNGLSPSVTLAATPTPQDPGAKSNQADAPPPTAHEHFVNGGQVSMADGTPLGPDPITAYTHYVNGGVSGGGEEVVRDGWFYLNVPHDTPEDKPTLKVAVGQRGCAVAFAGPFSFEDLNKLDQLEVKLTRGYSASVQIVDEAGRPVPGALLRPYYPGPPMVELPEIRTDAAGSATIEHVGEAPLNLRVSADGLQSDEGTAIHLDSAQPCRLTLKPAQPLHGAVTATDSGKPIAGAVIKLGGVRGPHDEDHYDPKKAPVLTSADAQGHFTLASLRPDSRYYLFVEAPGHGGAYLRGVTLAQGELNVTLGPELMIRGKIIHAPPSVVHLDKVHLQYGQTFSVGENSAGSTGENVDLQPVNGEADFTVGPFYKVYGEPFDPKKAYAWNWDRKPVGIYVDAWGRADFSIDELPISNFVFDLARKTDDRSPPEPDAAARSADAESNATSKREPLPVALSSPIQTSEATPTPAPQAQVVEIKATASTEDGAPAADDSATAYIYESSGPNSDVTGGFGINQPGLIVNHQKGRFTIRPRADSRTLTCAVSMQGFAAVFAGPFAAPFTDLENLHLTLRKGYAASIETTDEAGQPVAGARLEAYYPGPPQVAFGEVKTDASGAAGLEHIGEAPLNVRAYVDGFQLDEIRNVRLDPAKPYHWTLKRGLRTAGIITDEFQRPIEGATIKLAGVRGSLDITNLSPDGAPLLATADSLGGFALIALRADCSYYFFVEAPGYSGVYVRDYNPVSGALLVNLGPELMVRGKVLHIPDSAFFLGGVPLFYSQSFMYQDNGFGSAQRSLNLHPKNGEADFSIGPFFMTQTGSMPGMHAPWDNGQVAMHVQGFPEVKITVETLKSYQPLLKNPRFGITYDLTEKTPSTVTLASLMSQLTGKPSAVPSGASASPDAESPTAKRPAAAVSPTPEAGSASAP